MPTKPESASTASQSDKFKEAARRAECDEDEGRWEERLRKVARQKAESGSGGAEG